MDLPKAIMLEIEKCSKCGKCMSVCPVYVETQDEKRVTRGRISLFEALLDDELRFSPAVRESIQSCLKCLRCVDVCTNDVRFDKIITEMRNRMPRKYGLSILNKLIFRYVLPNRLLTNIMVHFGYYAQFLLPGRRGIARHLPLLWSGRRSIPKLDRRSVLAKYGSGEKARPSDKAVYYFSGCMLNYTQTDVTDSIVRLLRHFGYRVIVPKGQVCCGTPVMSVGDLKAAEWLARHNLEVFEGDIPIVTPCASCGETLKHGYASMLGDEASQFTARVFDFAEFVDKFVEFDPKSIPTTHDIPRPVSSEVRAGDTPRAAPPPLEVSGYHEAEGSDYCCGMAGLFSVHHFPLSRRIADRKMRKLKGHEGEVLVTECPGCIAQLRDRLIDAGINIEVRHMAKILEEALLDHPGED